MPSAWSARGPSKPGAFGRHTATVRAGASHCNGPQQGQPSTSAAKSPAFPMWISESMAGSTAGLEGDWVGRKNAGMPLPPKVGSVWSSVLPSMVRPKLAWVFYQCPPLPIGTNTSGSTCGWTTKAMPLSHSRTSARMWSPLVFPPSCCARLPDPSWWIPRGLCSPSCPDQSVEAWSSWESAYANPPPSTRGKTWSSVAMSIDSEEGRHSAWSRER